MNERRRSHIITAPFGAPGLARSVSISYLSCDPRAARSCSITSTVAASVATKTAPFHTRTIPLPPASPIAPHTHTSGFSSELNEHPMVLLVLVAPHRVSVPKVSSARRPEDAAIPFRGPPFWWSLRSRARVHPRPFMNLCMIHSGPAEETNTERPSADALWSCASPPANDRSP